MTNFNFFVCSLIPISFFIGYIFGCYKQSLHKDQNLSFFQKQTIKSQPITIDEDTFVVDIKIDNLEKKYDSLGEIKQTKEDISSSVNKLKILRGKNYG